MLDMDQREAGAIIQPEARHAWARVERLRSRIGAAVMASMQEDSLSQEEVIFALESEIEQARFLLDMVEADESEDDDVDEDDDD